MRVFGARGSQGLPWFPATGTTTAPVDTMAYLEPLIIVCGIAGGIAVIVFLVALILCCCRCCCNQPCKGNTDPENNYLILRIMVVCLCVLVLIGAFLGLFGGKEVSHALRETVDDAQAGMFVE